MTNTVKPVPAAGPTTSVTSPAAARSSRLDPAWLLFAAAVGIRVAWIVALAALSSTNWSEFLNYSDASSFLQVARSLLDRTHLAQVTFYDTRVFPFWPACEALLLALALPETSTLVLTVLLAGLVPVLYYRLTDDLPVAYLFAVFPPTWLAFTVRPFSEACFLALGMLLAWNAAKGRLGLAGLCAGAMIATKPFALAWALPLGAVGLVAAWRQRRSSPALRVVAGAGVGLLPLVAVNLWLYHDVLHQFRVYAAPLGQLNLGAAQLQALGSAAGHSGLPFEHVLLTPWRLSVPLWKTFYIYTHVAVMLFLVVQALPLLRRGWTDGPGCARWILVAAFVGNSALSVCTGPYWGFHSFDRYLLWGAPGAFVVAGPILARHRSYLLPALAVLSLAATGFALGRHL